MNLQPPCRQNQDAPAGGSILPSHGWLWYPNGHVRVLWEPPQQRPIGRVMSESSKENSAQTWVTTTLILEGLAETNNHQAWSAFVGYFKPILIGFARKSGLNQQAAEDFAQQAMLEFFKSYRTGNYDRSKGRLSHWLFGIARKVLSQTFRKRPAEKVATDLQKATSDSQPLENLADPSAAEDLWQQQWEKMVLQICMDRARKEFDEKTFTRLRNGRPAGPRPAGSSQAPRTVAQRRLHRQEPDPVTGAATY